MSSEIKVSSVKAKDGTAGISIADSSGAITANGGIANAGTITAGTIGTGVTINAGSNVSGIGQLVGVSYAGNTSAGTDGNDVTVDVNKDYVIQLGAWAMSGNYWHMETWKAVGTGSAHTFTNLGPLMVSANAIQQGSSGAGTLALVLSTSWGYGVAMVFEQGTGIDIT